MSRETDKQENKDKQEKVIKQDKQEKVIKQDKQEKVIKQDEHLKNIKCSKCGSDKLSLSIDRSFTIGYIKCGECGNYDTRTIINGELSNLVKCDICGSSTTKIISNGYSYPLWHFDLFKNLDIEVLCNKCKEEHFIELSEKDEKLQREEADVRVKELEERYKEEEKQTISLNLTQHQLEYILGLIEEDDDYATDMCLNEDIEGDYEFNMTKKIYEDWQNNLKSKFEKILD